MKEFLCDHCHELFELALAVLVIFVTLFKKKVKVLGTIQEKIYEILPSCINSAETSGLKGQEKLNFCVDLVKGTLGKFFPGINLDFYTKFIKRCIEDILATPQKKGD